MFGNNDQKQQEKFEKMMSKYELSSLDSKYMNAVKNINQELARK